MLKKIIFLPAVLCGTLLYSAGMVRCDFKHDKHLQGVASDGSALYWVFTDVIVKSDPDGKVLKKVPLHRMPGTAHHGGDPCFADGKLFVPYSGSGFNKYLNGRPNSNFIQQYNRDLEFEKSFPVPELEFGAGAVAMHNGSFFVAGGRPGKLPGNTIYEYDRDFKLKKKHELAFSSKKGIQSLTTDGINWYFGVYASPGTTFVTDMNFAVCGKWNISCAVGLLHLSDGKKLKAVSLKFGKNKKRQHFGGALAEIPSAKMKLFK